MIYSANRWKLGNSKEEQLRVNSLNDRYSTMFYYLNQAFEKGEIDLPTLNTIKNTLADRYLKESASIFIETRLNRIFNNRLEKMIKTLR